MKKKLLILFSVLLFSFGFLELLRANPFSFNISKLLSKEESGESTLAFYNLNFTENFENATGWSFINETQTNKWHIGTGASTGQGSNALYISHNGGLSNYYNVEAASRVYAMKTLAIPAATTEVTVEFDWRCLAQTGNLDFMRVWITNESFVPVTSANITPVPNQRIQVGDTFNSNGQWSNFSTIVNVAAFAGQNVKLIIEWRNNSSVGVQPPAAIDNIKIFTVLCIAPSDVTSSNVTANQGTLSWVAPPASNVVSYDYYYSDSNNAPDSTTEPIGNTTDLTTTVSDLEGSSIYYFWVRTVCTTADGVSVWTGPHTFNTLPENDECEDATVAPVNGELDCIETVPGTFNGATLSTTFPNCTTAAAVKDVWYEFTATHERHIVSLSGLTTTTNIFLQLFQESACEATTMPTAIQCQQGISMTLNNLVPGQTYLVRVYTTLASNNQYFDFCVTTILPPISVSVTDYTVEELVTEVLVGSECLISNVSWSTGTTYGTVDNGIAYFNKNGSAFQFEDGVLLSTGNYALAPGPAPGTSSGTNTWLGDQDLFDYMTAYGLNVTQYRNASVLEFDFTPVIPDFSFEFIFASKEYGTFQCTFSDAFAFFLTDTVTGEVINLALLPDGITPISVTTIRDCQYYTGTSCADGTPCSLNEQFFGYFYGTNGLPAIAAPISFAGSTIPLLAESTVIPGRMYHIKLVIADRNDTTLDSAVFIKGGSFNIGQVDFGEDMTVENNNALCEGEEVTLDSGLDPLYFEFEWYRDDVLIPGADGPSLVVNDSGVYKLVAIPANVACVFEQSITIEIFDPIVLVEDPDDLEACAVYDGYETIDLTINEDQILSLMENTENLVVSYHFSSIDAEEGENPITDPENFVSEELPVTIYVRVYNEVTECYSTTTFDVNAKPPTPINNPEDVEVCIENRVIPVVDLTSKEEFILSQFNASDDILIQYFENEEDALVGGDNPIINETNYRPDTLPQQIYIRVTNIPDSCDAIASFNILQKPAPEVSNPEDVIVCVYYGNIPVVNLTSVNEQITSQYEDGDYSGLEYYHTFDEADLGINPILNIENFQTINLPKAIYIKIKGANGVCDAIVNFTIVEGEKNELYEIDDIAICNFYVLPELPEGYFYSSEDLGAGQVLSAGEILSEGHHYLHINSISEVGCVSTHTYEVVVTDCNIQKGISPNGDGLNDYLDLSLYYPQSVQIFNRHGKQVYSHGPGYTNQWHGQDMSGNALPNGTYFYRVVTQTEEMTGYIQLVREIK